ncbi:uncharacterized protein LOC144180215 [Haemaphysalis longicornis]
MYAQRLGCASVAPECGARASEAATARERLGVLGASHAGRAALQAPAGTFIDGPRAASARPLPVSTGGQPCIQPATGLPGLRQTAPVATLGARGSPAPFHTGCVAAESLARTREAFLPHRPPVFGSNAAGDPAVIAYAEAAEAREAPPANTSGLGTRILPPAAEPPNDPRVFSRPDADPSAAHAVVHNGDASPDATSLLQQATRLIQSLSGALQVSLGAPKLSKPLVRLEVPVYRGYEDTISVTDFIESLAHYQTAMGLSDSDMLARVVPVALTERAAQWYRLAGHRAATFTELKAAVRREFLPVDYHRRMRRELELRTQAPEESLLEFVRSMEELYQIAEPTAPNDERVERVIRQAHPTFAAYLRGARFRDLEELAAEAKRIQGHILASRAYRPPPPASEALEPRCAWKGASSFPRHPPHAAHAVGAEEKGLWEISARALDPYTYGRRTANAGKWPPNNSAANNRPKQPPGPAAGGDAPRDANRGNTRGGLRCFRCGKEGHMMRNCSQPPAQLGNAEAGRAGRPVRPK